MLEFTCFTPALLGSPLVTCQFQTHSLSMALANPYKSYPAFWQESGLDCLTLYFLIFQKFLFLTTRSTWIHCGYKIQTLQIS